jgi:hypothetical protein
MSSFPVLVRTSSAAGEFRSELGDPMVDSYLEFVAVGAEYPSVDPGGRIMAGLTRRYPTASTGQWLQARASKRGTSVDKCQIPTGRST